MIGSAAWFIKEDLHPPQQGRGRHYASRSRFHLTGWTANQYKIHEVIELEYHNQEMNRLLKERTDSENYHSEQMISWIKAGAKNANTSFTAGPQRQIAYAIEELIKSFSQSDAQPSEPQQELNPTLLPADQSSS